MVCHSVCGADDMTDVTIWQNFLHPHLRYPLTLGSRSAGIAISLPKVSRKNASTCALVCTELPGTVFIGQHGYRYRDAACCLDGVDVTIVYEFQSNLASALII